MSQKINRRLVPALTVLAFTVLTSGAALAEDAAADFQMEVAGRSWVATRSQIFKAIVGKSFALNVNAFLEGSKTSRLGFMIVPQAEGNYVQTYHLGEKANAGNFNVDVLGGDIMESSFVFENGELAITSYDADKKTISGTFNGKLKNHAASAEIEITKGKFDAIEISQ